VLPRRCGADPRGIREFLKASADLSPKAWPRYVWIAEDLPSTATTRSQRELITRGVDPAGRTAWKRNGTEFFDAAGHVSPTPAEVTVRVAASCTTSAFRIAGSRLRPNWLRHSSSILAPPAAAAHRVSCPCAERDQRALWRRRVGSAHDVALRRARRSAHLRSAWSPSLLGEVGDAMPSGAPLRDADTGDRHVARTHRPRASMTLVSAGPCTTNRSVAAGRFGHDFRQGLALLRVRFLVFSSY